MLLEILPYYAYVDTFHLDSSEVRIEGLETLDYLDNLSQQERFTKQEDAILTTLSSIILSGIHYIRLSFDRY